MTREFPEESERTERNATTETRRKFSGDLLPA